MPTDKDLIDTVRQVVADLITPQLDEIKASLRRIEKKLEARPSSLSAADMQKSRALSPLAQEYMDTLSREISQMTEYDAKKWNRQRAKDPKTRIWPIKSQS